MTNFKKTSSIVVIDTPNDVIPNSCWSFSSARNNSGKLNNLTNYAIVKWDTDVVVYRVIEKSIHY